MATARAVATPASPDISMPSQPSGLSSAKRLVPSPTILRNEVTELPGSSVAWAAPFGNGVMIFIAASRGVRWSRFGTEITGTVASWSPERGLWFNPRDGVLLSGCCRYSVGPGASRREGVSDVGSNGFAAGLHPGGAHLRPPALDGHGAWPCAGGAGNQLQGYRVGSAELAPRHPDRQLLQQHRKS